MSPVGLPRTDAALPCGQLGRSAERRLTRVRLDLHDGPLQDVALLAGELADLRKRLAEALPPGDEARGILSRVDDVNAIVSCLDGDLRELANSVDAPSVARQPFAEALNAAVRKFATRSDIDPSVHVAGNFDAISDSQRIALVRIVQEALSNVRDHSAATEVSISIEAHETHVEAVIRDDGCGFDVDEALAQAAREGRMGVLGMMERVRLLGGACDVSSWPGHGTTISLRIARWTPNAAQPVAEPAQLLAA